MSSTPLLRQHYTLPTTPELSAESAADSDTDENSSSPRRTPYSSVRGPYSFGAPYSPTKLYSGKLYSHERSHNGGLQVPDTSPVRETLVCFPDEGAMLGSVPEEQEDQDLNTKTVADVHIPVPTFSRTRPKVLGSESHVTFQPVEHRPSVTSEDRCPHRESINDSRGSRWSINHLRKLFEEVKIEELYQRFWLRLQRILLFKLLIVVGCYVVVFIILNNTIAHHDKKSASFLWTNLFLGVSLLLCVICIGLVMHRTTFSQHNTPIALLVWVFLIVLLYAFMPFADKAIDITVMDNVPMTFFVIFVIHTMLPSPRRVAFSIGVFTAVTDLVILGVKYQAPSRHEYIRNLCTNVVIYMSAIVTGLYHKHLTDLAHRHTFLDVRKFIEEDIRNARERDRQNRLKEGLLLKIIPKHLLEDMKQVLNRKLVEVNLNNEKFFNDLMVERLDGTRKPSTKLKTIGVYFRKKIGGSRKRSSIIGGSKPVFRDLFVEKSNRASILYADIVSFTPLTMSLTPAELVRALNELFGRFDELAKANRCMKIKILGDCYYCVSGLPEPTSDHARNCVIMGMQMIKVIRRIREETGLEKLDMRIGIHSGYVLSGVLGLKKWQYDVWSDDVTIANHMESSGEAGKVHITASTLAELGDEFEVKAAHGKERDTLLKQANIETYFIADHELDKVDIDLIMRNNSRRSTSSGLHRQKAIKRRISMIEAVENWGAEMPFESMTEFMMAGTLPAMQEVNKRLEKGFHLQKIRQKEEDSLKNMFRFKGLKKKSPSQRVQMRRKSSDVIPMSRDLYSHRLRKHAQEINSLTLQFHDSLAEEKYANQRDASFKFYIICALCIFTFLMVVLFLQFISSPVLFISLAVGLVLFLILIVLTTGLKCMPYYESCPTNVRESLATICDACVSKFKLKALLSLLSCAVIFVASVLPMLECREANNQQDKNFTNSTQGGTSTLATSSDTPGNTEKCFFAPYFIYTCMLCLIVCSVFLRLSYMLKSAYMSLCILIFNVMFYEIFPSVFSIYDQHVETDFIKTNVRGTLYTSMLFVTLVVLDRQIEKNLRLDFLCKSKIQTDREELGRNEMLNTLLLNNILPSHVAKHFTNPKRTRNELYHQLCKNSVVMFAAVPNFKAFFSEIDVTGKECLRMLNEIISAFDDMLIMRQYDGVEKIKTIGSTYMAASGLVPSEDDDTQAEMMVEKNLLVMVQFAFGMMKKLEELSKDAFFEYKLRIGICHGEVISGVIGAQKPQYDIWGDTVNTASRMESHGVMGAIQVPEKTAAILQKAGYPCEYRDEIDVKGKGRMRVFLVQDIDQRASDISVTEDTGKVQIYHL